MFSISDLVFNNFLIIKLPQQGYDPGVTNRPIRFKLTARTDDPKYANSQVIPDGRGRM